MVKLLAKDDLVLILTFSNESMKCLEYWALIPPNLPKQSNSDNETTVIMDSKHLDHMALIKLTDKDQLIFGNDYYNQLRCQEVDHKVTDEEADLAVIQMTQEFLHESLQFLLLVFDC